MNSNKKTLTAILILLVMCTGISISYAFFKVASSNNKANSTVTINGAALCMSLQLSSDNITISNEYAVPISDSKALSSDTYKTSVTITNNCNTSQSFNLLLVPNSSNTMPIKALKYALVEEGVTPTSGTLISNEYILDSTIQKQLLAIKNETLKNGFSVGSGIVSSGTKTYSLYLWIDKDEGSLGNGSTMNKSLNAYLTLGSGSKVGTEIYKGGLYKTIENRYEEDKTYLGLYDDEGSDSYPLPVYYYQGNVSNNNLLFGGFCWKIVRTTETGGVKIVYNGVPKGNYNDYTLLNESEYKNLTNDTKYPYTFDSTNKTWTITTTELSSSSVNNSSTITFTVPSAGNYVLNYDLSMYFNIYYAYVEVFKDNVSQGKFTGVTVGQIVFNDLNTSNVIKVVTTIKWKTFLDNGRNNVVFSFGKLNNMNDTSPICNNTGTDSQIGTSAFNSSDNSLAYVGYMYNTVYEPYSEKLINSTYFSGTKAYADSVTYDNTTGKYSLDSGTATTLDVSTSNGNSLIGKYTCDQSTTTATCESAYYIAGYNDDDIYYYLLENGDTDGEGKESSYIFGKSFTYTNGTYTLNDVITINPGDWGAKVSMINNYHYTCLSNVTTCSSINYIHYTSRFGNFNYIKLTGGKSIDDALNEMLYADNVNTKDSTIKAYIDNWYENNLTSYENKLEDTVFCNDRSIAGLAGWNPNGGDASTYLSFNSFTDHSFTKSLMCKNETDRFSMSNNKAKLKYPVGLLTSSELKLANYEQNHYYNTEEWTWFGSPFVSMHGEATVFASSSTAESSYNYVVNLPWGVRPSVSLKPGTSFSSGDGSYTSPFVID